MIAAVEGMEVSQEDERRAAAAAADPRGPEATAAAAAADAALRALQAVSAASVGAAGMAALASLQRADAPSVPPPVIGLHQHATGAGGGGGGGGKGGGGRATTPKAEPSAAGHKRRKPPPQQQQHQQRAPARPASAQNPDAWLGDVGQSAARLLERLGLAHHQAALDAAGVDLAALRLMGERHLLAIGLPMGAVVKLRAALGTGRGEEGQG